MEPVDVGDLEAHLEEHLARVRGGESIVVIEAGQPIARIVPYVALEVRKATRPVSALVLPPPPNTPTDSLSVLLEDRARR